MKKKIVAALLCAATLTCGALGISACSDGDKNNEQGNSDVYSVYLTYVAYAESNSQTPLSYESWLATIKGEKGADGRDGRDGKDGVDGKDGRDGRDGKDGTDGLDGKDGKDGKDGTNGVDGKDGVDGQDGQDGKSAYQLWLEGGNTGTQEEFLYWLKNGVDGQDGKSAYQIWLDEGNTGTQTEFLEWLKGAAGKDGKDGTNGTDGQDGKSAYQIWLDNGNTGTQAEFLEWLKGTAGKDGKDGTNGQDGKDGVDGQDGKSAYQIWLDEGNTGTQAEFLEWLKGTAGKDGKDGTNGTNGQDGKDGKDGKSAYQIWLDEGNTGTQADFLNWLRGTDTDVSGEPDPLADHYGSYYRVDDSLKVANIAEITIDKKRISIGNVNCLYDIGDDYITVIAGMNVSYITVENGIVSVWNDPDDVDDLPDAVYVNKTQAQLDADDALKQTLLNSYFSKIDAVSISGATTCEGGDEVILTVNVIGSAKDKSFTATVTEGSDVATLERVAGEANKLQLKTSAVTSAKTVKVTVTSNFGGISEEYTLTVTKAVNTPYRVLSEQNDKVFANDFSTDVAAGDIPVYAGLGKTAGAIYQHGNNLPTDAHAPVTVGGGKLKVGDSAGGGIARAYIDFGADYQEVELTAVVKAAGAQNLKALFALVDTYGNVVFEIGTGDNYTFHFGGTADNSKPDYAAPDASGLASVSKADVITLYIKADLVNNKFTLKMGEGEIVEMNGLTTVYNEKTIAITSVAGIRVSSHNVGKNYTLIDNLAVCGTPVSAATVVANNNAKIAAYETTYALASSSGYSTIKSAYTAAVSAQDLTAGQANAAYGNWYASVLAEMQAAAKDGISAMLSTGYTHDATKVAEFISIINGEIDAKTELAELEDYLDGDVLAARLLEAGIHSDAFYNAATITLKFKNVDGGADVTKSGVTVGGKSGFESATYAQMIAGIDLPTGKKVAGIYLDVNKTDELGVSDEYAYDGTVDANVDIFVEFVDCNPVTNNLRTTLENDSIFNRGYYFGRDIAYTDDDLKLAPIGTTGIYAAAADSSKIRWDEQKAVVTGTDQTTERCINTSGALVYDATNQCVKNGFAVYCGAGPVQITVKYFNGNAGRYTKVVDANGNTLAAQDGDEYKTTSDRALKTATYNLYLTEAQWIYVGSATSGLFFYDVQVTREAAV